MKKFVILLAGLLMVVTANAQEGARESTQNTGHKRAWEFGLGGTVYQFNRIAVNNFSTLSDGGYHFGLDVKNAVWGGNIYVARELTNVFTLDFQGSVGFTTDKQTDAWHKEMLFAAGLGLQWRLGHYFGSRYIDPYLRVGGNYMYKGFDIAYANSVGGMEWILENDLNKDGADSRHLFTVAAGAGVNMWLNDRWGIGIQGDYLIVPKPNVANSLQGTVRVMFRLGGKSKKPTPATPVIQYVDRPVEVERVVERIVEVEKIVEVPGNETRLMNLFNDVFFDFDRATLTGDSQAVLDEIAEIIKGHADGRYLISGFTDTRGSDEYNQNLSEQRARAVVDALVGRGVPKSILKARGAGERIAIAGAETSDGVRRGDRKVTIEIIANPEYWDYLQKR